MAGERSSQWPTLRKKYIYNNPRCACCGSLQDPQVHHIIPFKANPELELDYNNLITLCKRGCHLKVGHGGDYQCYNPLVREDVKYTFEVAVIEARKHRISMR